MKKEIVEYVASCVGCHQVKIKHQRPYRFLQPLDIPKLKWDDIFIDFIVGLPCTLGGQNSI